MPTFEQAMEAAREGKWVRPEDGEGWHYYIHDLGWHSTIPYSYSWNDISPSAFLGPWEIRDSEDGSTSP